MGGAGSKSPRKKELSSILPFPNQTNDNHHNNNISHLNKQNLSVNIKHNQIIERQSEDNQFQLTEGQQKRALMADYEFECSEIFPFLYVAGAKVAQSWEMFIKHNITTVVNCSASIIPNYFADKPNIKYLTLNMVDGHDEDLSWFICEVIQYIYRAKLNREKVLLHCEKGVSRSISFAIVYHMWSTGSSWKKSFSFVKERRQICNPNVAFTCNLAEIDELLNGDAKTTHAIFRFAWHLPHDMTTPVLKICRNPQTRKIISPAISLLDSNGVFVVRPIIGEGIHVYVWQGSNISDDYVKIAYRLAENMKSVLTNADNVVLINEGKEPQDFFKGFILDEPFDPDKHKPFKDLITSSSIVEYPTRGNIPSIGSTASLSIPSNPSISPSIPTSPQTTPKNSVRIQSLNNKIPTLQIHSMDQSNSIKSTINSPSTFIRIRSSSKVDIIDDNNIQTITRQDSKSIIRQISLSNNLKVDSPIDSARSASSRKDDGVGIPEPTVFSRSSNKVTPDPIGLLRNSSNNRLTERGSNNNNDDDNHDDDSNVVVRRPVTPRGSYNYSRTSSRNHSVESLTTTVPTNGIRKNPSNKMLSLNLANISTSITTTLGRNNKVSAIDQFDNATEIMPSTSSTNLRAEFTSPRVINPSPSNLTLPPLVISTNDTQSAANRFSGHSSPLFNVTTGSSESPNIRLRNGSRPMTPLMSSNQLSPTVTSNKSTVNLALLNARKSSTVDRTDIGLSPSFRITNYERESSMASRPSTPHLPIDKILSKSNSKVDVKLPVEISLIRDATPATPIGQAGDLASSSRSPEITGRELGITDGQPSDESRSSGRFSFRLLDKPLLFQAKINSKSNYEWISMGLYDDEDLDETTALLLICPETPHYLWIGSDFVLTHNDIAQWACVDVEAGELSTMKDKLGYLLPLNRLDIIVEKADAESQSFWDAFNDGF